MIEESLKDAQTPRKTPKQIWMDETVNQCVMVCIRLALISHNW